MDEQINLKRQGTLLYGFDLFDIVNFMQRTNKKYQATLLANIEEVVKDPEEYAKIRKLVLDSTNNYLRTIIKTIFGGIEI